METPFRAGQRVTLQAQALEAHLHALVVQVTFGEGVRRRLIVPLSAVRDAPEGTIVQPGSVVTLEGKVERTLTHHNGVTGVTVSFGEGIDRRIVVPSSAVQASDYTKACAARHL